MFIQLAFVVTLIAVANALPQRFRDQYIFGTESSNATAFLKVGRVVEKTIEQPVNHFNPQGSPVFNQRYFVDETYWERSPNSPVFMCVGGEGPPLTKVLHFSISCPLIHFDFLYSPC